MKKTCLTFIAYTVVSTFLNLSYASQFAEDITEIETYAKNVLTEDFIQKVKSQTLEDQENPDFIMQWDSLTFEDSDTQKIHHTLGKFLANQGKQDIGIMDDFLEVSYMKFKGYKEMFTPFKDETLFQIEKEVISFVEENPQYAEIQTRYEWPTKIED